MSDHYLKFVNEMEMLEAFSDISVGGDVPSRHNEAAIDIVGLIVDQPASIDFDGTVISEAIFVEGWHVNWYGHLPEEFGRYGIEAPATPARVRA